MCLRRKNIIHIGDHNLDFDIRVKAQIASLGNSDSNFYCREKQRPNFFIDKYYFSFLLFLVKASLTGLFKIKKIYIIYKKHKLTFPIVNYNVFFVYKYFFKNTIKILNSIKENKPDVVIANDLACGLIAAYCKKKFNIPYYYDSHEFQIFRNYRNSFLKCILVSGLEHIVINNSLKYCVVNKKIGFYYKYLYQKKGSVVVNNFYASRKFFKQDDFNLKERFNIVYFGYIRSGRGLEYLEYFQQLDQIDKIFIYTDLGQQNHLTDKLKILPKVICAAYPRSLIQLQLGQALGLCLIENVALSYTFSLPNKFFQYLACGIPIITISNTYLAEIVTKFKIGVVISEKDFKENISNYLDTFDKVITNFPLARKKCIEHFSRNNYDNFFENNKLS